jgi:hypothetical protein
MDFPDRLLEAQKDGSLVIFAGAGVSVPPPSNFPNFDDLVGHFKSSLTYFLGVSAGCQA